MQLVLNQLRSISLDECIDLAITYIYQGNHGLKVRPTDLKTLFFLRNSRNPLLIQECVL